MTNCQTRAKGMLKQGRRGQAQGSCHLRQLEDPLELVPLLPRDRQVWHVPITPTSCWSSSHHCTSPFIAHLKSGILRSL
jgi:hypothetical protein